MKPSTFQTWAGLCLLTLATGCGSQQTANQSADPDAGAGQQANRSSLSSPFAALSDHPQFELSDLQFPRPNSFVVRWRVISGQATGSWALAVIPSGNTIPTSLTMNVWDDSTSGEISGELRSFSGGDGGLNLASGCEVFLTAIEGDHTFKISNSLTAGSPSITTPHPPGNEVAVQVDQHRTQAKQKQLEEAAQLHQAAEQSFGQGPSSGVPNGPPTGPQGPSSTPVSRPPGMVAIPPRVLVPNGTRLIAKRGEQWLSATVVGSRDDGFVQVRWEDNSGAADEFLHRANLGIEPATLVQLRAASRN